MLMPTGVHPRAMTPFWFYIYLSRIAHAVVTITHEGIVVAADGLLGAGVARDTNDSDGGAGNCGENNSILNHSTALRCQTSLNIPPT